MSEAHVEYLGFKVVGGMRSYLLRVRQAAESPVEYTLSIPTEAFLAHRVRYQDAPEICFLKLRRELSARPEGLATSELNVSDAELEEYRLAHSPAPQQRRPKPPNAL
jgi:hypothetical protein